MRTDVAHNHSEPDEMFRFLDNNIREVSLIYYLILGSHLYSITHVCDGSEVMVANLDLELGVFYIFVCRFAVSRLYLRSFSSRFSWFQR